MIKGANNKDWIWDRYWRFDRIASCFDTNGSNYPPEFEAEWNKFFKALPGSAKILDLCTGNGAISRMAADYSKTGNKSFEITGVDRADINPDQFVGGTATAGVTYSSGISIENLPFQDASFDAVISQYGFEYADKDKAAAEAARVLKPGGMGKFICHAAEGVPAGNGKVEVGNISYVTHDLDLFTKARAATTLAWRANKEDKNLTPGEADQMAAFGGAMKKLSDQLLKDPENPYFKAAFGLLQHTFSARGHFPLETLIEKIDDTEAETLAHLGRVQALLDASLTETECQAFQGVLQNSGFQDVTLSPFSLREGDKLVGWNFDFRRLAK